MTTPFGRLKDVFLDDPPDRAFLCTYGFEPDFFEQEILPSMLPQLTLDRGAGNVASYLNAGYEALRNHRIVVCCDHFEGGRELPYDLIEVKKGSMAFHPKLLLLDYGDVIRVVVSSANLTRSGWSNALELFVFEDLEPGGHHGWKEPLTTFVHGVQKLLSPAQRQHLDPFMARLSEVRKPGALTSARPRLLSTFEGPMIDSVTAAVRKADRIDVVTPFLEGEEGSGVLKRLLTEFGGASGQLFVRAEGPDGAPVVRGPEAKLRELIDTEQWTIRRVRRKWDGDDEDAPPRELHGKLLSLRSGKSRVALVGSANVTTAALMGKWPAANVELGVLIEGKSAFLDDLLPPSDEVAPDDLDIQPPAELPEELGSPADWVEVATYHGQSARLELWLKSGAPSLEVSYEGKVIGSTADSNPWSSPLRLGKALEVTVAATGSEALVPFLVLELELIAPPGMARSLGIDELLEIMAGAREPVDSGDAEVGPNGLPVGGPSTLQRGDSDAFAWRRLMRALAGLERDLVRAGPYEVEVRRLLDGPLGAMALMEKLDELRGGQAFVDADLAFAIHELRCSLGRVRDRLADDQSTSERGQADLRRWQSLLSVRFEELRKSAEQPLRKQLNLIRREVAARA